MILDSKQPLPALPTQAAPPYPAHPTHALPPKHLLPSPIYSYSIMMGCWKARAEERSNFDTVHSLVYDIYNKYAAIQSTAPPTTHGLSGDINYSTFGKDLRSHDAFPMETLSSNSSYHRRLRSGGGTSSLKGSLSRGSPATSQRNSMGLESGSGVVGDQLSITFSVLSNENDLEGNSSCSEEAEDPQGLNFEIPSFLMGQEGVKMSDLYPTPVYTQHAREESPMDMVSTFLVGPSRQPSHPSHDHIDYSSSSFFTSPPVRPPTSNSSAPLSPTTPTNTDVQHASCDFSSNQMGMGGGAHDDTITTTPSHSPLSTSRDDNMTPPAISVTPSNPDTISKPSTPDSVLTTYSSSGGGGPHSMLPPTSHIPGIPNSTYNSTSVSIDDVKLRNRSLLNANPNTNVTKSSSVVSTTPSGASKSDSGIRSDEEVESVLSNGGPSEGGGGGPGRTPSGRKPSVRRKDSEIGQLSSDLMATFASWGKN